jgi:hypothetical protein
MATADERIVRFVDLRPPCSGETVWRFRVGCGGGGSRPGEELPAGTAQGRPAVALSAVNAMVYGDLCKCVLDPCDNLFEIGQHRIHR